MTCLSDHVYKTGFATNMFLSVSSTIHTQGSLPLFILAH